MLLSLVAPAWFYGFDWDDAGGISTMNSAVASEIFHIRVQQYVICFARYAELSSMYSIIIYACFSNRE